MERQNHRERGETERRNPSANEEDKLFPSFFTLTQPSQPFLSGAKGLALFL